MTAFTNSAALLLLAATYLQITNGLFIEDSRTIVQLAISNLTVDSNVHCANDNSWLTNPVSDIIIYERSCQGAQNLARMELESHGLDTKFEFFERTTRPKTTKPKIMLPRKYTVAGARGRPSCTVALAMIDSLSPGDPLPDQPPGSLGSSDVAIMRQLTRTVVPASLARLFGDYMHRKIAGQRSSALGWAQAGQMGNIGIFIVGTRSEMDRRITGAIHPSPPRLDDA